MVSAALCLTSAALLLVAPCSGGAWAGAERSLRVGGTPLELLGARGWLWALTCDRRCGGEARHAAGRIVRIDPRSARVVGSAALPRPGAIAVGASGVYVTDFWRDRARRLDLRTLRVVAALKLRLPFRFSPRDNAFLPFAVAVGPRAVWVATDRGALARADLRLRRVVATLRLPFDAFGGMAVGQGAVWLAESLAGLYRVDPSTNRVVARIRVPLAAGRFDAGKVVPDAGELLVLGARVSGGVLTDRNLLARIDPRRDHVQGVTPLPSGSLAVAFGGGSLWVAQSGGSSVERIDPRTGKVVVRFTARVGAALAFAGGHLWTVFPNGVLRRLPT